MVFFHPSLEPLLVDVSLLRPWDRNPNNGDVDLIVESIRTNGVFTPVVAQRSTGVILAGNHRYAALMELGETRVPVVWVDVDDAKATRIALVDNRSSQKARTDQGLLLEHLLELSDTDLGLEGTGFDTEYLDFLIQDEDVPLDLDDGSGPSVRQRKQFQCPNCGWAP